MEFSYDFETDEYKRVNTFNDGSSQTETWLLNNEYENWYNNNTDPGNSTDSSNATVKDYGLENGHVYDVRINFDGVANLTEKMRTTDFNSIVSTLRLEADGFAGELNYELTRTENATIISFSDGDESGEINCEDTLCTQNFYLENWTLSLSIIDLDNVVLYFPPGGSGISITNEIDL